MGKVNFDWLDEESCEGCGATESEEFLFTDVLSGDKLCGKCRHTIKREKIKRKRDSGED